MSLQLTPLVHLGIEEEKKNFPCGARVTNGKWVDYVEGVWWDTLDTGISWVVVETGLHGNVDPSDLTVLDPDPFGFTAFSDAMNNVFTEDHFIKILKSDDQVLSFAQEKKPE